MSQNLIPSRLTNALIGAALLLPIAICVLLGVSKLLGGLGDAAGGGVLNRIALGCGVLWILTLVVLLIVLAVRTLEQRDPGE